MIVKPARLRLVITSISLHMRLVSPHCDNIHLTGGKTTDIRREFGNRVLAATSRGLRTPPRFESLFVEGEDGNC